MKKILSTIALLAIAVSAFAANPGIIGLNPPGGTAVPTATFYGTVNPNGNVLAGLGSVYFQNTNNIWTQWLKTNSAGNTNWAMVLPLVSTNGAEVANSAQLGGKAPSYYESLNGISLRSFGAVGDGVTDDTAAVQSWANYICSTNCVGLVPPGSVGYLITNAIQFTNTARIFPLGGGSVYAGSDFPFTHCRFIQSTRGADAFDFTSYADSITVYGMGVTNTAANNFTNRDSCGFKFTGAIGAHVSQVAQCGAANFGRGFFSVDLAASTFISDAGTWNGIGIEVTNQLATGNYPVKLDSCVFAFNLSNQVVCSSTTIPFTVANCIITPFDSAAHSLMSYAKETTLISCGFGAINPAHAMEFSGGTALIENCGFQGSVLGVDGRYAIVATNCNLIVNSFLAESNTLNGASVYLYGSGSRLFANPATAVVFNDGSGNLSTNASVTANSIGNFTFTGTASFATNAIMPAPIAGQVRRWYSNYDEWIITPFKTNRVIQGQ